jgi:hypothetical protein
VGVGTNPAGVHIGDDVADGDHHHHHWRHGGIYNGIYYPGWWWFAGRWIPYPPYGIGYGGGYGGYAYGGGYSDGGYAQSTPVAAAYNGPGVGIRNPTEHEVNFTIDGQRQVSVKPGETLRLTEFADFQISFDRGDRFGTATYTIYEGLYEFAQTERGWELYRQKKDAPLAAEPRGDIAPRTAERPMAEPPLPPAPAPRDY